MQARPGLGVHHTGPQTDRGTFSFVVMCDSRASDLSPNEAERSASLLAINHRSFPSS
jgi:hypothetical protein